MGGYTTLADGTKDIVVAKLNYNIGTASWLTTHDGGTGENDEAIDLATDGTGQLYLCGNSYKVGNSDYYVAKLKNTTGDVLAQNRFNGVYNLNDIASNMVVTSTGDIYIAEQTGVSGASGNSYKYALTKWSEKTVYVPKPNDGYGPEGFYSNAGQLRNVDLASNANIKFYNKTEYPQVFINDTITSFVFANMTNDSIGVDTMHRVDMKWNKGNTFAKVYPLREQSFYMNHYIGANKKVERNHPNDLIVKQGAYTNTSIYFSNNAAGLRIWLVATSGAPTSDFEFQLNGQSALALDASGNLVIHNVVENYILPKAKAYTMNNTSGTLTLLAWQPTYSISGNNITLSNIGTWSGTLVIQIAKPVSSAMMEFPDNIEWSTFYGVDYHDKSQFMDLDIEKDVYISGHTYTTSFPTSTGPYFPEGSLGGNLDLFVVAFNPAGCTRHWGAVYGGDENEVSRGVMFYDPTKTFVTGVSASEEILLEDNGQFNYFDEYPYQQYGNGNMFLLMFDSYNGSLKHATHLSDNSGSSYYYQFGPMAKTSDGDLYIASTLKKPDDYPIVGSGFSFTVDTSEDEASRGMIMKFNEAGDLLYSTLFGCDYTNVTDMKYDDATDQIYIVGSMKASTELEMPKVNPGGGYYFDDDIGVDGTDNSYSDGFILRLNGADEVSWFTYFGNDAREHFTCLKLDGDKIYLGGQHVVWTILPTSDIPLLQESTQAIFDTDAMGGSIHNEAMFLKFESGQLTHSTYLGGEWYDIIWDIDTFNGKIYMVGGTNSEEGFQNMLLDGWYYDEVMNDGPDNTPPDGDAFIMRLSEELELEYATFFGGTAGQYGDSGDAFTQIIMRHDVGDPADYAVLLATGHTNSNDEYPVWEFDTDSPADWYDPLNAPNGSNTWSDATMLRMTTVIPEVVSISETQTSDSDIICYPSPTSGDINFLLQFAVNTNTNYNIYDVSGALVSSGKCISQQIRLDASRLSSGFYTIIVTDENKEHGHAVFAVHH